MKSSMFELGLSGLVHIEVQLDTTFAPLLRQKGDEIHNTVSLMNDSCVGLYSSFSW